MKTCRKFRYAALASGLLLALQFAQSATITVNSAADDMIAGDGKVTLREAITSANNNADANPDVTAQRVGTYGNDFIRLSFSAITTITILDSHLPAISGNLVISNAGSKVTVTSAVPATAVAGVFSTSAGANTTLEKLVIKAGTVSSCIRMGGASLNVVECKVDGAGTSGLTRKAIDEIATSTAVVNLRRSTVTRAFTGFSGQACNLIADQSTFNANDTGVQTQGGQSLFTNCTFADNRQAISISGGGCKATHCTIAGNTIGVVAVSNPSIVFHNTICTDPKADGFGFTPTLLGNNILSGNPVLGPLAENGGVTMTRAPLPGSPAIDQALGTSSTTNTPVTMVDQRGYTRPIDDPSVANAAGGNASDIGAVEVTGPNKLFINSVTQVEQNSGDTIVFFTVSLLNPASSQVSCTFSVVGGTASVGSDFQAVTSSAASITFSPGQRSKFLGIAVKGDTVVEPHEDFHVNLLLATGADIVVGKGTCTIVNDD